MDFKIIVILFVAITSSLAEFGEPPLEENTTSYLQEDKNASSHLFKRDTTLRYHRREDTHMFYELFKRHILPRQFTYADAAFRGIGDPDIEIMENERMNPHWFKTRYNNALKFSTDSLMARDHIITPLREVMKERHDTRSIIILSGGHGNQLGNNWLRVVDHSNPFRSIFWITRAPWVHEPDFWVSDVSKFLDSIGDEFQPIRWRIRVHDIAEMSVSTFRDIILSRNHVILAFCFGRNDRAYRYYLHLNPVISKVFH